MADSKSSGPHYPEKKIGPFQAGVGVAIWLNVAETDNGPRKYRSVTISPRRYIDRKSGEWQDSGSFYIGDLPALIYALQKAQEYAFETPIPGQPASAGSDANGNTADIPF